MPLKSKSTANKLKDIYHRLEARYGEITCPLIHSNPFELFVSVILSAQCTDKRVNAVTPLFFTAYPDAEALSKAVQSKLEDMIRPVGLFRVKSANLIEAAKKIVEVFDGKVPEDMESLTSLPGVGRKSANVILGNAFGVPGFPVDTHVIKLMNRIGIVKTETPEKIERVVNDNIDDKYWTEFSLLLITHGRQCCNARNPQCHKCDLECKASVVFH